MRWNEGRLNWAKFWEMARYGGPWFALKQLLAIGAPRAYYVPRPRNLLDDPAFARRSMKVLWDKNPPRDEE